jgi:serine/threonine-protein kinase
VERGETIAGRYRLVERLGRGGMGEVWAGWDRDLRRDVALKLLVLDDGIDPELPMRFEREGVAGAQVTHPNVVALYDRGVHEGLLFLVMEKVDGPPLSQLLRSPGGLTTWRALSIAGEICAALAAAHRAGVIHYDIKPHNVMLTADGSIKVVDFGIAGFVRSAFTVAPSALLGPAGTPEYAAPEQFRTERGDERSDLYALGGVLFAMLAGEPPFIGHNAWAIIARKATEDPPRLDVVRPDLPPAVTALVAQLLDRDPARRPRSAQEVHEQLLRLRAGLTPDPVPNAPERPSAVTDATSRVDRAVSIACRIRPPLDRAVALAHVAAAVAADDVEAAERIAWRHVPAPWLGVALLRVAEKMTEPARVRRLVAQAEPHLARATGHPEGPWGHPEDIALLLARLDPARAVSRLGGVEQLLLDDADMAVWRLVTVAELAGSVTGTDPARAERIVDRLERRVRTLTLRDGIGHTALARIAAAVYPADRPCAERLLGLAEQAAAAERTGASAGERALPVIVGILVKADRGWAERIARRIPDEPARAAAWEHILEHTRTAEPGELPRLIDDVERQLARLRRRPGRVFGSYRTVRPGHGRDLVKRLAPTIAAFAPTRAEALTEYLDPRDRADALTAMARRVSGSDPEQARVWLGAAYRTVLDDKDVMLRVRDVRALGRVVGAAAAVDRQLARNAAQHLARMIDKELREASTLADLAEHLAEVDAGLARRLIDRIAYEMRWPNLGRADQSSMARALIRALVALMAATDENDPEDAAGLIDRLREAARLAGPYFQWGEATPRLAERNPRLAERLIAEYDGPQRDGLLAHFVTGLTPKDPDLALRIAESFADDEVRNAALRQIAVGVAEPCLPRRA